MQFQAKKELYFYSGERLTLKKILENFRPIEEDGEIDLLAKITEYPDADRTWERNGLEVTVDGAKILMIKDTVDDLQDVVKGLVIQASL